LERDPLPTEPVWREAALPGAVVSLVPLFDRHGFCQSSRAAVQALDCLL
jgi:hypothetical protein